MTRCFKAQVLTPRGLCKQPPSEEETPGFPHNQNYNNLEPVYMPSTSVHAMIQCICHDPVYMPWTSVHAMNQCVCQTGLADDRLDSIQFSSVAQSCPTLCNPVDYSTPGLPVYHPLLKFTQIHVHRVGDAIQPSHPLFSPSSPGLNLSQHQGLFKWVSSLHQVAKLLEFQFQHQSFQWIFRTDYLNDRNDQIMSEKEPSGVYIKRDMLLLLLLLRRFSRVRLCETP